MLQENSENKLNPHAEISFEYFFRIKLSISIFNNDKKLPK